MDLHFFVSRVVRNGKRLFCFKFQYTISHNKTPDLPIPTLVGFSLSLFHLPFPSPNPHWWSNPQKPTSMIGLWALVMSHIGFPRFCFGQHRSFRVGAVCMQASICERFIFCATLLLPTNNHKCWIPSAGNLGNVVQCVELAVTSWSLCVCVPNYYAILWCFLPWICISDGGWGWELLVWWWDPLEGDSELVLLGIGNLKHSKC